MRNKVFILSLTLFLTIFTACNSEPQKKTEENKTVATPAVESKKEVASLAAISANALQSDIKMLDGKTAKLDNYKGKIVLVNLWATWCIPCKEEMPELIKLQTELKDKGVEIIGLTVDKENDTPEKVKKFVGEQKLNYQIGWLNTELQKEFEKDELIAKLDKSKDSEKLDKETLLQTVPKNYLINQKGEIIFGYIGFNKETVPNIKKKIEEILPKN